MRVGIYHCSRTTDFLFVIHMLNANLKTIQIRFELLSNSKCRVYLRPPHPYSDMAMLEIAIKSILPCFHFLRLLSQITTHCSANNRNVFHCRSGDQKSKSTVPAGHTPSGNFGLWLLVFANNSWHSLACSFLSPVSVITWPSSQGFLGVLKSISSSRAPVFGFITHHQSTVTLS